MAKGRPSDAGEKLPSPAESATTLPTITALQFLVLDLLSESTSRISAQQLRLGLESVTSDYQGPKFYQLMARMKRDGLVTAETCEIDTEAGGINRTFYSLTPVGRSALRVARVFYATRHRLKETFSHD